MIAKPPSGSEGRGERDFVAELRKRAASESRRIKPKPGAPNVRTGIGDDCAILLPGTAREIVVTTDLFLEQVHFRRGWHQPEVAGHRCLARGLSDIAAMGASPFAAFLSLALPRELSVRWADGFLSGLLALARVHGVTLAGGDTAQAPATRSGSLFTADIVLLGSVARGRALLRSGAQPGDRIYVTGSLGGAAAELARLSRRPAEFTRIKRPSPDHPHLFPVPRLNVGAWLIGRATAAIDLSDGLSTDLDHLCAESRVAAEVEASLLPVHPLALRRPYADRSSLDLALHGGEDYELLFTAPPRRRIPAEVGGVPIHRIGSIGALRRRAPRVTLLGADGKREPLASAGWEHFR